MLAALAMVGTLPGRTQGLGLITEPLLTDLQVDRVSYATMNLWATLLGALFCFPCGKLLDRYGSRVVLGAVTALLGGSVLLMSWPLGLLSLAVGITLSRGLGQSALSVASLGLVGKWFTQRLNFAMGLYSLLVGIGFIAAFPSVGQAVLRFGWRATWTGVGLALLLVLAPLFWWRVRDRALGAEACEPQNGEPASADFTFIEAVASPAFWIFGLSSAIFGLVYSGIALFNQSILEQRGFDAGTYHEVLVISTMLGLAANFGGGWLATRWPIQRLMGVGMGVLAGALLMLPVARTQTHVVIYGMAMGVAGGVVTVVLFSVWAQVFGRRNLGRIQGAAQMLTVLASALGPLLLAETLRRTGSYDAIFQSLAVVTVLLGLACWVAPLPSRPWVQAPVLSE
jgi:MFS family permease